MRIVTIEGPSHAGKSTLLAQIERVLRRHDIKYLPDYVDAAGGPLRVPDTPGTGIDEIQGLLFFLQVEVNRLGTVQQEMTLPSVCFLDRSVHTLLAHRYAVQTMRSVKCYDLALRIVSELCPSFYPGHIFYLDTPEEILAHRREERIKSASSEVATHLSGLIFDDPEYNVNFRRYFDKTFDGHEQFHLLDGSKTLDVLVERVRCCLDL